MFRRIFAVCSAVVVLPGLLAAASIRSSEVTVATGTITRSGGAALPGVTVWLYAWPSDAVLQSLKAGQTVPWTLLATATTSSSGSYTLQVPQTALTSAAVGPGYANLEIDSPSGDWSFAYPTDPPPGQDPQPVTVNIGGNDLPTTCTVPSKWYFLHQYYPQPWAVVGQGYILRQKDTKGDWMTFKYTQSSSHEQTSSLGQGVSAYGFEAGYHKSGSNKETATRSEGFGTFGQRNAWFRTQFRLARYRQDCLVPIKPKHRPKQKGNCPKIDPSQHTFVLYCVWKVRSDGWFGGESVKYQKKAPHTPYFDCGTIVKGGDFDTDMGTAVEWSKGFEMGAKLDIKGVGLHKDFSGSSQTGYDHNAYMKFTFPHHAGFICGTNGPPGSAAQLVARDNRAPK